MDNIQSTLRKLKKQEISQIFRNQKRALLSQLEKSGLLKRRRKVKNYNILLHAANLYLIHHLSFRRLSYRMAQSHGVEMSDVAWQKQLVRFAPVLLTAVQVLLKRKGHPSNSILAIDATSFSMEGNRDCWFRVHSSIFPQSYAVGHLLLTDQHTAESVHHFPILPGRCYLADRAYGKASQMAALMEKGADFVVRIPLNNIRLFLDTDCRKKIDWASWLSGFSGEKFSMRCFFPYQKKIYSIRLMGFRMSPEQRERSRKRARRASQQRMNQLREKTLLFADWLVLATSLLDEKIDLYELYRQRWQIELFFKTGKSLLNFHRLRRCSTLWAEGIISIWMASVTFLSMLHLLIRPFFPSPSFFFSFDFLSTFWI